MKRLEKSLHKPVDREKHPCFYVSQKEIRPLFNKRTFNRKMIIPCCFNPQVRFDVYDTQTNLKIDKELAIIVDVKDINDNPSKYINIPETVTAEANQEEDEFTL